MFGFAGVGSKILCVGGDYSDTTYDTYDVNTGNWSTSSLPSPFSSPFFYTTHSTVGIKALLGPNGDGSLFIYDGGTETWTVSQNVSLFGEHSASSSGSKAFFVGGNGNVTIYTIEPSISSFSPSTGAPGDVITLTGNFDPIPANNTVTFNGVPATVTASSYTSLTTTVPAGATTGPITISYGGFSGSSSSNFSVTGSTPQTITGFSNISQKTYTSADFTLSGAASSGLPVTYTSSNTSIAVINGFTVDIVGVGVCTITASQAGNGTYRAAPDVVRTLTVNKANQTINTSTFTNLTKNYASTNFDFAATATSGLPVTYSIAESNIAVLIDENTADIVGIGDGATQITAYQAGNDYYNEVTYNRTLTVTKATPTISFASISSKTFDQGSYQFVGTIAPAGFGLTITYSSATPAVATIGGANGDVATFTGVGTSSITASRAEDANFFAATSVSRTLTVNKGVQTITFAALDPVNSWDPDYTLTATASSGLPVTYASSNAAIATIVNGNQVHFVAPGTVQPRKQAIPCGMLQPMLCGRL
jgi:hypothetical protein